MADTYTQIYLQIVLVVKYRQALIQPSWEGELYRYISGIIKRGGNNLIRINGAEDHLHILMRLRPSCCLSDLIREVKKSSNKFINDKRFTKSSFSWQNGFGAFSYHHEQVPHVIKYIEKQKEHHRKVKLQHEYKELLQLHMIEYKEEHLFNWILD